MTKFKVGGVVRCTKNTRYPDRLTVGKKYIVVWSGTGIEYIKICDDRDVTWFWYNTDEYTMKHHYAFELVEDA